jgi:hypothetical protein
MGVIARQTENEFAGIPIPDFIDIILYNRDGRADEAMYCLLHQRLSHRLRQHFEDSLISALTFQKSISWKMRFNTNEIL